MNPLILRIYHEIDGKEKKEDTLELDNFIISTSIEFYKWYETIYHIKQFNTSKPDATL